MKDFVHCTGCGACAQSCPTGAISMIYNMEGFLYPITDASKCINCGKCHKICSQYEQALKQKPIASYSGYAVSEQQREGGSSGGLFGVLAQRVLNEGGVVFGAVFSSEERKVRHVSTQRASIEAMKRSKYVQSDTEQTFSETKELLQKGVCVLYSGTPCQIMGLKSFLGKDYENLLTVDFMCHGVPSPGLFEATVSQYEKMYGSKVKELTFREKKLGWRKLAINVYFENGMHIQEISSNQYYYYHFLHNYTLRMSCFSCELYSKHVADITVADYWTVPKEKDDDKGISLIFVNSEKGQSILEQIKEKLVINPYTEPNMERFSHRGYCQKNRNEFFDYYIKNGAEKAISKYTKKMKRKRRWKFLTAPVRKVVVYVASWKRHLVR